MFVNSDTSSALDTDNPSLAAFGESCVKKIKPSVEAYEMIVRDSLPWSVEDAIVYDRNGNEVADCTMSNMNVAKAQFICQLANNYSS